MCAATLKQTFMANKTSMNYLGDYVMYLHVDHEVKRKFHTTIDIHEKRQGARLAKPH